MLYVRITVFMNVKDLNLGSSSKRLMNVTSKLPDGIQVKVKEKAISVGLL